MKSILLIGLIVFAVDARCLAQSVVQEEIDVTKVSVDQCLLKLLSKIAKSDRRASRGRGLFYSVIFRIGKDMRYINIVLEKQSNSQFLDYKGVLVVNKRTFLFRGDVFVDELFQKDVGPRQVVMLEKVNVDSAERRFFPEPSLQGVYTFCKGAPIYVEVYTDAKIKGYDMELPKR